MHTEVKQTETSEFGVEKGLVQGTCEENGWLVLRRPELFDGLQGRSFYRQNLGEGLQVCDPPLISRWYFRNLNNQPSSSNRSGVHMLMLSLKLPSSPWVGAPAPIEELRDMYQIVMHIPRGNQDPVPSLHYCF